MNNTLTIDNGVALITMQGRVELNAAQLAAMFWALDEGQQEQFFNELGLEDEVKFNMQMYAAGNSGELNGEGREVLRAIGEAY